MIDNIATSLRCLREESGFLFEKEKKIISPPSQENWGTRNRWRHYSFCARHAFLINHIFKNRAVPFTDQKKRSKKAEQKNVGVHCCGPPDTIWFPSIGFNLFFIFLLAWWQLKSSFLSISTTWKQNAGEFFYIYIQAVTRKTCEWPRLNTSSLDCILSDAFPVSTHNTA